MLISDTNPELVLIVKDYVKAKSFNVYFSRVMPYHPK